MEDRVWASYERQLRLRGIAENTLKNYRRSARLVQEHTGTPVIAATRLDLEELLEDWLDRYASSTRSGA